MQPHYVADPIFQGCVDPLAGRRTPVEWEGTVAPFVPAGSGVHARPQMESPTDDAVLTRMRRHATFLAPSIEGQNGDDALWNAAQELATHGAGEEAILTVLREVFNPRCVPPWPDDRLRYYARKEAHEWHHAMATDRQREKRSAETASRWNPPAPSDLPENDPDDPLSMFYEADDYSDTPLEFVCASLGIAYGKVTHFNGHPACGKTPCSLSYAIHAAWGHPWCGHEFNGPVPTLYLAHEGGSLAKRKRARMCRALGIDPKTIPLYIRSARGALHDGSIAALKQFCTARGIKQIIVDTLTSANRAAGVGMNDTDYANNISALGEVSESTRSAVIMLTHSPKEAREGVGGVAGSFAIAAASQCIWTLTNREGTITWRCDRAPEEALEDFTVRIEDVAGGRPEDPKWGLCVRLATVGEQTVGGLSKRPQVSKQKAEGEEATRAALPRIWKALKEHRDRHGTHPSHPGTMALRDLYTAGGEGKRAAERALARLKDHGLVEMYDGHHRAVAVPDSTRLAFVMGGRG